MTIFELALFIAILVFVILLVATILNNSSDFHARTPWFEITLSIKSRISNFTNHLPSPLAPPRYRLHNHDKLISFKYHLFVNAIGVVLSFLNFVLLIIVTKEWGSISLINLIDRILDLPDQVVMFLLSIPCILLLIKKLEVSWLRALVIINIALFFSLMLANSLWSFKIITDWIVQNFIFYLVNCLLLTLGSWINYKLEWD